MRIAVDLFCGAGGLSEGLRLAGYTPALGVDIDPVALRSYRANHPETSIIETDIANLSRRSVLRGCGNEEIDLLAGGPSCQGFSTHGKRRQDDPRNSLLREMLRVARETKPRFVLLENVAGLRSYGRGAFEAEIAAEFSRSGYSVASGVLNAADFGVPQLRKRIVFIGTRLDLPLAMPAPTHYPPGQLMPTGLERHVTVGEALGDLPLLGRNLEQAEWDYASPPMCAFQEYARFGVAADSKVTLHQAHKPSDNALRIISRLQEGQKLRDLPDHLLPDRFKRMRTISDGSLRRDCTTLYGRLDRGKPAYTITCYFRNVASGAFTHPVEDRTLSYREAARLMSFRDSYVFHGPRLPRQIGNAVPPLLAAALGRTVLALDEGRRTAASRACTGREFVELGAVT